MMESPPYGDAPVPRPCPLTDDQLANICRLYADGVSQHELSRRFGVDRSLVLRTLRRRGVAVRTIREICSPPLREDAFDRAEEDEQAAYWVGFLMADGCVSHYHSRPAVILQLGEVDADHVTRFLRFVGSDLAPRRVKPGRRSGPCYRSMVYSERLADSLASYGVTPRKSATTEVRRLAANRHFWRGVVDGDGNLAVRRRRNAAHTPQPVLQLVGSEPLMRQFASYGNAIAGAASSAFPSHGCWGCTYSSGAAAMLVSELYTDCTVALPRKWAVAHEMLSHWSTRTRSRGVSRF